MWLINTKTLQLEEFISHEVAPDYAILSHTWKSDEISFQEMTQIPRSSDTERKLDGSKVLLFCKQVTLRYPELIYGWVDTCCIDKKSSAELSEAINSMFNLYQNSKVCMVFLSDVYREPSDLDEARLLRDIAYSRWFTRGWTLQELLAPNTIVFFDCRWSFLGNARDKHMTEAIIKATNIENIFLTDPKHCSVAARMSWAAHRSTTRTEDIAYCLLGLLDVSMPLLYGEGSKAFRRLQEEIIRSSNDESIFAWASDRERFDDSVSYDGILASSPADFVYSVDIVPCHPPRPRPMPYSITNYGLEIDLTYQRDGGPYEDPSSRDIPGWTHWTVPLACRAEKDAGLTGYFRIRLGMASPQIFSNDSQGSMIFRRNPHSITFFKRGEVESQDFPSRKFHIQLSL